MNRDGKIGSPNSSEEHLGTGNGANRLRIDLEMAEVDCGGSRIQTHVAEPLR
jgi:hypothetical protein